MGGDGENGLALAVFAATALMLAIGFALFFAIGWALGRRSPSSRIRRPLIAGAAGVIGVALAACAVAATFFETSWSPPPRIHFIVPSGFHQQWVILLEDPSIRHSLVWHGVRMPFRGLSTEVTVPAGGVLRVRDLGDLPSGGDTTIRWSDGASAVGFTGGATPAGLHATRFVAYERQVGVDASTDILPDGNALVTYIRARGG